MSRPSNIVRFEILPGLPGEGPVPNYFHCGHPTPWAEGFVVRFWDEDGADWVGNFKPAWSGINRVLIWPQANGVAVVAGGNFYLLDAGEPSSYWTAEPNSNGRATDIGFDEDQQTLFVAGGYSVYAFDSQRRLLWEKRPGDEIIRILSCFGGILRLEVEPEMGEPLETAQILVAEESVADRRYLDRLFGVLRAAPEVRSIGPGLSNSEIQAVEREFKFGFPPDLRGILQFAVPIGPQFPDWRDASCDDLRSRFDIPLDGICFDVEHNNFWLTEWGGRPSTSEARRDVVRRIIANAPRLIPIFSHRFIPSAPYADGNPVFSVHQTDIIHYGNDLAGYFRHEFGVPLPE